MICVTTVLSIANYCRPTTRHYGTRVLNIFRWSEVVIIHTGTYRWSLQYLVRTVHYRTYRIQ